MVAYNIDGLLLLDKPINMSSNAALQTVKKIFAAKKAGHTGSLDPLASGMLPLCFGNATKFSQFLLESDKFYQVTARLGIKTETGDAEGAVIVEKKVPHYSLSEIKKVLEKFTGKIEQVPSMYSALKHNGEPLYKLARQGIVVEREKRSLVIYELELLQKNEYELELSVHCSKGTYVRTLVEDIGEALGCGAHVSALRRLRVGPFMEKEMVTLEQLLALVKENRREDMLKLLLPIDAMLLGWPEVIVPDAAIYYLRQGQSMLVPHAPTKGNVKIVLKNGRFLGVGAIDDDGKVAPKRLI